MEIILDIGQWQGFYKYGSEYGSEIEGIEAEFRLFVEQHIDNEFKGRIIDWDENGVEGEPSIVNGFMQGKFISFTKQYPHFSSLDENGNLFTDYSIPGHCVTYEGNYEENDQLFSGTWEIRMDIQPIGEYWLEDVVNGTWRMFANRST